MSQTSLLSALSGLNLNQLFPNLNQLLTGKQDPSFANLINASSLKTTSSADLLKSLLGIGTTVDTAAVAKKPSDTVWLKTYDVNVLRQLGDAQVLGGNGDGILSKNEATVIKGFVDKLYEVKGEGNKALASLKRTAGVVANDYYFSQIAGQDGTATGISGVDVLKAALTDSDKRIDTTILKRKPVVTQPPTDNNDLLLQLLKLLLKF